MKPLQATTTANSMRRFMTAEWLHLLMLNYEIDPSVIRPLAPLGTELDTWNGRTFVSMVAFRYRNTRIWGVPIPFHRHFSEINLRFYVRRRTEAGWRRGVVFIKEVVPLRAVASIARWLYNENFVRHRMRFELTLPDAATRRPGRVMYGWQSKTSENVMRAEFQGEARLPAPNSEEEFITEHYWGYSVLRDGSTCEYRVDHPPWRVWRAVNAEFKCDVKSFYGCEFESALSSTPASAFIADGSAIVVYRGERIGQAHGPLSVGLEAHN